MYAITSIESFIKSRAEIEVNDGTIIIKPKLRQELTESAIHMEIYDALLLGLVR